MVNFQPDVLNPRVLICGCFLYSTVQYSTEQSLYTHPLTRSLSLFQIYALKSVSIACVAVSAATVYHYQWGICIFLHYKYQEQGIYSFLVDTQLETELEFTDQENTMLAISSLAIVFSIIEIVLAFASAKSCSDTGYNTPQENQVCIVTKSFVNFFFFFSF